jgi:hypothetical protein
MTPPADMPEPVRSKAWLGIDPDAEIDGQVVTRPVHPLDVQPA